MLSFFRQQIPNFLTCCNLFLGCLAILSSLNKNFEWAFYFTLLAGLADFLDGAAARLLKVSSPIGKELDSLADVVTFGVSPAIACFVFFNNLKKLPYEFLPYLAFLIAIFSAIRLAKFNVDTRQSESFIGLPTPANGIFWFAVLYLLHHPIYKKHVLMGIFFDYEILISFIIYMSAMLVVELPIFALKFKHLRWKENEIKYLFLAGIPILFIFTGSVAFALSIQWYIVLAFIYHFFNSTNAKIKQS